MKNIIFGILASLLFTSSVYAGKGKKKTSKKNNKAETCTPACCDKTKCPPANCDVSLCK